MRVRRRPIVLPDQHAQYRRDAHRQARHRTRYAAHNDANAQRLQERAVGALVHHRHPGAGAVSAGAVGRAGAIAGPTGRRWRWRWRCGLQLRQQLLANGAVGRHQAHVDGRIGALQSVQTKHAAGVELACLIVALLQPDNGGRIVGGGARYADVLADVGDVLVVFEGGGGGRVVRNGDAENGEYLVWVWVENASSWR